MTGPGRRKGDGKREPQETKEDEKGERSGGPDIPSFHYFIVPPSRPDADRVKRTQFGGPIVQNEANLCGKRGRRRSWHRRLMNGKSRTATDGEMRWAKGWRALHRGDPRGGDGLHRIASLIHSSGHALDAPGPVAAPAFRLGLFAQLDRRLEPALLFQQGARL